MISIDKIRIDGGTQIRIEPNQETIDNYTALYSDGVNFPPIIVFFDGVDYWLADGFHRYFAAINAGRSEINETVINGTKRDAILFSLGANGTHGLNRTNADKRNAVETMLKDAEWVKWSDNAIARQCHVSPTFVGSIRKSLSTMDSDSKNERVYTNKQGSTSTMQTANIGKKQNRNNIEESEETSFKKQESKVNDSQEDQGEDDSNWKPDEDHIIKEQQDKIDDLQEENEKLRSALAINQIPEGLEIEDADTIIDTLRARVKQLEIEVKAITQSRDTYLRENSQLKEQIRRQAAQLKKLGVKASA